MTTILIVEDDYDILNANKEAMELEGYKVATANTLEKGRKIAEECAPDLIILDILLPDGNGLKYCAELRGKSGIRILFLSALNAKADVLAGLKAGGDDYMSKPYDMEELVLRVDALLRRGSLIKSENSSLKLNGLEINLINRRAFLNGQDLLLSPKEFTLLEILIKNNGSHVSSKELYMKVWGMNPTNDVRTVKEHISRLRNKLGENSGFTILSKRGKGYRLQ